MARISLVILIIAFVLPTVVTCDRRADQLPGEITITGRITDAETGEPIKNVIVYADREHRRALTDEQGNYRLDSLQALDSPISLHRYGYRYFPPVLVHGEDHPARHESDPSVRNFEMRPIDPGPTNSDTAFQAGYDIGWKLAEAELQNGKPSWYIGGLGAGTRKSISSLTGVPHYPAAGCVVDNRIDGTSAGHNDRVLKYIADHGIPELPRLWKYQHRGDLQQVCRTNTKPDSVPRIWAGSPALTSPDSVFTLQFISVSQYWPRPYLQISHSDTTVYVEIPQTEWDTLQVFWGPSEDSIAVIRTSKRHLSLLDLTTGKLDMTFR